MEKQEQGTEKVRGVVSLLKQSKIFSDIEVLEFIDEDSVQLLKIKATVKDGSILFVTELHAANYQKYSYPWQKENGDVLIRWDNAPHFKEMKTFPYHKHENNGIFPSHRISVAEVIQEIKMRLDKR